MNDRLKWRMWSTHAGRYFDENNDAMLENVFECMKQQICYDCQNPILRKIYDRIAYNHIEDGMVFEQCTGIKDRNGKLIYENDLIKIDDDVAVINWSDYYARFMLESSEDIFDFERSYAEECEVIGNIHENADLIKVGGE
jgi:uncharacterized phage protein (TIGR01671 family)